MATVLKEKVIKWGYGHILHCMCCFEMERRGYKREELFWDDFFEHKEKPIKYIIIKGWGKDKGKIYEHAEE